MPFIFLIFADKEQENLIFIGKFRSIQQIIDWTDNCFKYTDSQPRVRTLKTYKNHFRLIELPKKKDWREAPCHFPHRGKGA